ncbi:MAG: hypothetical protein ACKVTZ_23615 [Bacteroidia bacterium]
MLKFVQIFVFLLIHFPFFLYAKCDCTPSTSAQTLLDSATYAFQGKAIDLTTNWMSGGWKITFRVEKSWKKQTDKTLVINAPWEKDCGINFAVGKEYLVFTRKKFTAKTDICAGTRALDSLALSQIAALGEGMKPYQSPPNANRMILITSLFGILSLAFMGYVVLRNKFRKT